MNARDRAVAAHFDSAARAFDAAYEDSGPGGYALRARRDAALALLPPAARIVLDAGCGSGRLLHALPRTVRHRLGIDGSAAMVRLAAAGGLSAVGAAGRLPIRSGSIDAVFALAVVEYVRDDRAATRELARVLRPGGVLIATFPNTASLYRRYVNRVFYPIVRAARRIGVGRSAMAVTALHHSYERAGLAALLRESGLILEHLAGISSFVLPPPLDQLAPRAAASLAHAADTVAGGAAGPLSSAFLVLARKAA